MSSKNLSSQPKSPSILAVKTGSKCRLCSLALPKSPILEDENAFCCVGCLTVYNVLSTQNICEDYRSHPLFRHAQETGAISNPKVIEKSFEGDVQKIHLEILEMWCPSCAEAIQLILLRHKGIKRCIVDYATDLAVIEFSPLIISKEDVFNLIRKLGYQPQSLLDDEKRSVGWIRFGISAFCTLNLMMFAYPLYTGSATEGYEHLFGGLSLLLAIPLITYGAWPIWRRFLTALRTQRFGMETLVILGISTTFIYSAAHLQDPSHIYYDSMGMILTFVLLGKILERRAKFSAKESLFRLTRTLPKKGYKQFPDGTYAYVSIKEIEEGDTILARCGEKIVLDGIVSKGDGIVDESVMSGEATPVRKLEGSSIVGGSIVKSGSFHYVVGRGESLISKIAEMVQQNLNQKRLPQKIVDRLIPFLVPSLILLAITTGDLLRGLSVLLISCPCALGIAVPLAEALLLHRFAEKGALVRNRAALTLLAKDPLFVFDKTGTLTEGRFRLLSGLESLNEEQRSILKALCQHSTHPISVAISEALQAAPIYLEDVCEVAGRGIKGKYQGKTYRLGSAEFTGNTASKSKFSTVVFFENCTIELGDQLRKGIPKVDGIILSGDSQPLVTHIAEQCGFQWGKGECDPLQKRAEIEKLKKKRIVTMVGDGINDAPALSAADIGISVVSASDLSIEASDLLLTTEHLSALPELIFLAKRGRRIILQNLFWAFFYNGIGVYFALSGRLTPLFSAIAMVLSSLFVTFNSLRIKYDWTRCR